jgi:SAM-dependent methyltransferase
MEGAGRYQAWILDAFEGSIGADVLEVGFGHAGLGSLLPPGTRYLGVDNDAGVVERAKDSGFPGTYVVAGIEDEDFVERVGAGRVDTVFCFNVLEHVVDDRGAIRNLLGVLRPGGRLLLFVPALEALYNDLDRLAGHQRRYTRRAVASLVPGDLGFIRKNDYFNPLGAMGWWLNGLIHHSSLEAKEVTSQVRFFETIVLPFSRALDPLTRRLFGQSIACTIERR